MDLLLWAPLGNADGVSAKTEKGVEDRADTLQARRCDRDTTCEHKTDVGYSKGHRQHHQSQKVQSVGF